ncbi:MAG: adenylate/guanylate cyclase domain-containing protein [Anaerolineae bacterium]
MEDTVQSLQRQLTQTRQALDIVLALDRVRDNVNHPSVMLADLVDVMMAHFEVEIGQLYLREQNTGVLELRVWRRRSGERRLRADERLLPPATLDDLLIHEGVTLLHVEASTLHLAALPLCMHGEPLGLLLLARRSCPFDAAEKALLETAGRQLDSAIVQARRAHELAQRNRELETIYRVDRLRDQGLPFDEMLNRVLHELTKTLQAEMGFVMLYDRTGRKLEMRACTHDHLAQAPVEEARLWQLAEEAVHATELRCAVVDDGRCDLMCVPLILRDEIIGVFGVAKHRGRADSLADEQRLLRAIVSQMDTAILESLERRRLRRLLGRSVDPNVLSRLLTEPDVDILSGERVRATVLYADLRGSTRLAEQLAPEHLVAYINDYLKEMTEIVLAHQGTLDKFVGDEVMALFGVPLEQADHPLRAVRVGLEMRSRHQELMRAWQAKGFLVADLGVGVATGEMIVGEMGCKRRTDYTAIGRVVNLGARICAHARPGQVLISEATYQAVAEQVEAVAHPGLRFKGVTTPVTVYEVSRLR